MAGLSEVPLENLLSSLSSHGMGELAPNVGTDHHRSSSANQGKQNLSEWNAT